MNINGKWYTETELQAYIETLQKEKKELEEKHLNECRQISEYDLALKEMKKLPEVNEKIERIVSHYNFGQQRVIFAEECSEAIQAVCKVERAADISSAKFNEAMWKFLGEIADVLIMAMQMRKYMGADAVDKMVMIKLDRQLDRIKYEDYAEELTEGETKDE